MTPTTFDGESLIFLISQPRAGSTLLQRLLGGHEEVVTSAEPWLMLPPVYWQRDAGVTTDYDHHWAHVGADDFLTHYAGGNATRDAAVRAYADVLYGCALARARAERPAVRRFLDKTPRYYLIIPDLLRLFPRARFVFLLRNPLAVLTSMLETWMPYGFWPHLAERRDDLLRAPALLRDGIAAAGDRAVTVRYEALVSAPDATLQTVCAALGLPWDPTLTDYGRHAAPRGSLGDPTGVNQFSRPSAEGLDKWRDSAERAQTRHFLTRYLDDLGAPLLADLGYDYAALADAVAAVPLRRREPIVPWTTALTPRREWTPRRRLRAEYALAHQRHPRRRRLPVFLHQQWLHWRGSDRIVV